MAMNREVTDVLISILNGKYLTYIHVASIQKVRLSACCRRRISEYKFLVTGRDLPPHLTIWDFVALPRVYEMASYAGQEANEWIDSIHDTLLPVEAALSRSMREAGD
jgi:hypothetical protein